MYSNKMNPAPDCYACIKLPPIEQRERSKSTQSSVGLVASDAIRSWMESDIRAIVGFRSLQRRVP